MDYVVCNGDIVQFNPSFSGALVSVPPTIITSSISNVFIQSKNVCVLGDENLVVVPNCSYVGSGFAGGIGTVTIGSLNLDQISTIDKVLGKPIILKGSSFIAIFTVTAPGFNSNGNPDPLSSYIGSGSFIVNDLFVKAS